MQYGIVLKANPDDGISGDAIIQEDLGGTMLLGGIDGLGHGPHARIAAQTALDVIKENMTQPLDVICNLCDQAMKDTRGAAMSLVLVNHELENLTYVAVGNVTIHVLGARRKQLLNTPGIVGGRLRTVNVNTEPFKEGDTLIIHSDGISERFNLDRYTLRILSNVQLLAEALATDFRNPRDDASILIAR